MSVIHENPEHNPKGPSTPPGAAPPPLTDQQKRVASLIISLLKAAEKAIDFLDQPEVFHDLKIQLDDIITKLEGEGGVGLC